jgi:two-component system, cell cycle sensor histidine kinase and response regulator CckA
MATPLKVLIVEDSPDDAALLVRELEGAGYDVEAERVDTPEALADALEEGGWDVLFADYTIPGFGGKLALEMVRSKGHDFPFIFVSGTMGEDVAVETLKAGANDYVLKGNLKRLVPAVERELRDASVRRERRRVEAERRAAEEALRASEERHGLLFEHIADVILAFDDGGRIRFAGASVREVLGFEPSELTGRPSVGLVHPDDVSLAQEAFDRVTRRDDSLEMLEVRMRHRDGTWRTMEYVMRNLLHHPDIEGVVVTCRDVSERKRLEADIHQAQKLESVGRLAGGIAHDFNNLLTAVLGYADMLLMDPAMTEEHRTDLAGIKEAAERAAALTGQLLAFSRRQVLEMRPLDLNAVIGNVIEMLRRLLGAEVEVQEQLAPELGTVRADVSQLEQVLLNLAVNARDAMPEGGRITIETANVHLDESYPNLSPEAVSGQYVCLTVSDTGMGMDAGTRASVFEPFFTTKPPGKGTGLGLATVYGIVKQSGGHIWVYSEPGHGASFKIYLPRVDEPAEQVEAADPQGPAPQGTETVLVVEDEPAVRNLISRVLGELGYTVVAAGGAEQAFPVLRDHEQAIDLLLTDAVLPGAGGKEIAEQAVSLRPELPVLFMSGYATPVLTSRGILAPGVELLHKPFTPAGLAHKVREVLDAE